ncbi:MAG: hypothetical protein WCF16_00955 [Alphaproteobacteria bacterium]
MIRRSTLVAIVLMLAIGIGLYQLKHEVQLLEERLADVNRDILADQEAIHVLDAEWTYLNRPWRLEALAQRHLELAPLAAAQVVTFDQLPSRLEPVISDATNPTAAGGANHQSRSPESAPRPQPVAKPTQPAAAKPAPKRVPADLPGVSPNPAPIFSPTLTPTLAEATQ